MVKNNRCQLGNKKRFFRIGMTSVFVCSTFLMLQMLLVPKNQANDIAGAVIGEYYAQDKNHDVIFVGDCEICTAFSPPYLWEKYGINSYVRGSVQQTVWQSYYFLEEMLQEENPKVVIFNVAAMKYEESPDKAYTRMTLDAMRWSQYKVKSVIRSLSEEEHFIEYLFPILFYHDRWRSFTNEDFSGFQENERISFNGYLMFTQIKPYQEQVGKRNVKTEPLSSGAYEYLDKIRELCKDRNIELILVKGPGIVPAWYSWWDCEMEVYAEKYDLLYINMLDRIEELGIDYSSDTFSGGRHMNVFGAEKVSDYIGKLLVEEYQIPDRRGEWELEQYWKDELEQYYKQKTEAGRKQ